jgi:MoaA/NifB/PqqE/SkfB family radical SAM enzyme
MFTSRCETSGLHFFNRKTGIHVLFDEVNYQKDEIQVSPRHFSIALTNQCNLKCDYCYNRKSNDTLDYKYIINLAKTAESSGVLELTFGGGEPLLHPQISQICSWIWDNTSLGISITTNGLLLNKELTQQIKNKVSQVRVSFDFDEGNQTFVKDYHRSEVINNVLIARDNIPIGINIIARPLQISNVEKAIKFCILNSIESLLIIPEHHNGVFILKQEDWTYLNLLISTYCKQLSLSVTYDAANYLQNDYLETESSDEFIFAHLSANKTLLNHSYEMNGIPVVNPLDLTNKFQELYLRGLR